MKTNYQIAETPHEPPKKPPGIYICPECKDAIVVWRTPVEKFKVKCPKCSVDMVRAGPLPSGTAQFALAKKEKVFEAPGKKGFEDAERKKQEFALDKLAEIYGKDKALARIVAASEGIGINKVALHYGVKQLALTGFRLGAKHGEEEAAGQRVSPGALKLLILKLMHGEGYIIGRQKGLSGKSGATAAPSLAAVLAEKLP